MKKFQFKLEPLLKYRKYQERIAQQETARAQLDVKESEQEIKNLEQNWDDQADTMENAANKGVSASQFQMYYQYLVGIETSIVQEKVRKQALEKVLKEKLLVLNRKSVDKKVMEVYQDRLKAEYFREMIQTEQKELDEVAILKAARDKVR